MTSAINPELIIATFPVAGKDNDSQGFRDNFASTKAGLTHARDEITELQSKALLSMNLGDTTPAINNFGGSTVYNGLYKQFDGVFHNGGVAAEAKTVEVAVGPVHKYIISGGTSQAPLILTFTSWPNAGHAATVRIMLVGDNVSERYIQFSTDGGGVIKPESSLTFPYPIGLGYRYEIFEAMTVDGGSTVFLRHLGQY